MRKHRFKPGTVAMRDIRKAQKFGNNGIPKTVIDKIVREIAASFSESANRFTPRALRSLHDAAEGFNTDLFKWASTISLSCNRKTLDVGSLKLASTLLLSPHVMHEFDGSKRAMQGVVRNSTRFVPDKPSAGKPSVGKAVSATDKPATGKPATSKPAAGKPSAGKPSADAAAKQASADAAAEDVGDESAEEEAVGEEGFMSADEA